MAGLIEKHHLAVDAYSSYAEGVLERLENGYLFTCITIEPTVVVTDTPSARASPRHSRMRNATA